MPFQQRHTSLYFSYCFSQGTGFHRCSYVHDMRRRHGEDMSDDNDGEQTESAGSNHSDNERAGSHHRTRVKSVASSSSSMVSPDYIRNAVLCMLRCTEGVNLPAMSSISLHISRPYQEHGTRRLLYRPSPQCKRLPLHMETLF